MKGFLITIGLFIVISSSAQKISQYHVVKTFHIQGDGKWDYIALNPVNNNLYVSHGTEVNILDRTTGDSTGILLNTTGVHGIAFAPAYGKGFTSNGKLNTCTVFDINSNQVTAVVKTGDNPDAIMFEPFTKKILTCNGRSNDLSVIDPVTNQLVATLPLGGKPETAVSDNAGNVYINIEDKNEIVWVDANTYTIKAHWTLGKAEGPTGLAIDIKTKRLFAGCDKQLVVVNATNGSIVTTMPIGDNCDGVAFDASLQYIFTSNGEGTMNIIKEVTADKYRQIAKVATKKGAKTLVVDERTHLAYLPTAHFLPAQKAEGEKAAKLNLVPGSFQVLVLGR